MIAYTDNPQAILIDLADVLHNDDDPIPGAADALAHLRASGLIVAKLRQMGFDVEADEILTAVLATRNLVKQQNLHPHYLVHPHIAEEIGCSHAEPDVVVLGRRRTPLQF